MLFTTLLRFVYLVTANFNPHIAHVGLRARRERPIEAWLRTRRPSFRTGETTLIRVSVVSALIAGALMSAAPRPQQAFHRPLSFEQNRGQAPTKVSWIAHGSGYQ